MTTGTATKTPAELREDHAQARRDRIEINQIAAEHADRLPRALQRRTILVTRGEGYAKDGKPKPGSEAENVERELAELRDLDYGAAVAAADAEERRTEEAVRVDRQDNAGAWLAELKPIDARQRRDVPKVALELLRLLQEDIGLSAEAANLARGVGISSPATGQDQLLQLRTDVERLLYSCAGSNIASGGTEPGLWRSVLPDLEGDGGS